MVSISLPVRSGAADGPQGILERSYSERRLARRAIGAISSDANGKRIRLPGNTGPRGRQQETFLQILRRPQMERSAQGQRSQQRRQQHHRNHDSDFGRPKIPVLAPMAVTIRPTSPREIMPQPTRKLRTQSMPEASAASPHPTSLPTMATDQNRRKQNPMPAERPIITG